MTKSNTRSKLIAAALAVTTLAGTFAATSSEAQARPRFGVGLGIGLAVGALAGAAIASHAHAAPVYVEGECYYKRRYNKWGNPYLVKVCNYY